MILCDREIRAAMDRGSLRLQPVPAPHLWTSTAIDLTLDGQIRRWKDPSKAGMESVIVPASKEFNYTKLADTHTETIDYTAVGHYDLKPKEFILGWTVERIQLPHASRIAARVEGKSSLARLGMGVHVTAPTIHAGFGYDPSRPEFCQPIQLEIFNVGTLTIRLIKGMPICQLIFEEVHGTPEKGYGGMFASQSQHLLGTGAK
jgi:dCTP deaminase